MDDASGSAADREQRHADVQTLLGLVDRRSLTAEQFHSACALLYDGQGPEQALSALIAAVSQGRASMAALIDAVTVPEQLSWTADRVVIWVEDGEAHAMVNLRGGSTMEVVLTKTGLAAERSYDDAPVATLERSYDELLPAPD